MIGELEGSVLFLEVHVAPGTTDALLLPQPTFVAIFSMCEVTVSFILPNRYELPNSIVA